MTRLDSQAFFGSVFRAFGHLEMHCACGVIMQKSWCRYLNGHHLYKFPSGHHKSQAWMPDNGSALVSYNAGISACGKGEQWQRA